MVVATDTKEAKYTQGFSFQHDGTGQARSRQLVERSCTALVTLMQELFVQVERQISGHLTPDGFSSSQQRLLEQLVDIVRARAVVERVMITSVVCAFAKLEDRARHNSDNHDAIAQALAELKGYIQTEDLMGLLGAAEKVADANNNNRPLLFHLNAQWAVVFGLQEFRLQNSPLSPATLVTGFVAGLSCVDTDLATKRMLFQMFEQHLLARLSILLNSITLRLEEEGVVINKAVSFDETDAGPVSEVLQSCVRQGDVLPAHRERIRKALSRKKEFIAVLPDMTKALESILAKNSSATLTDLLCELALVRRELEPVFWRADVHHQETMALVAIRQTIAEQLNNQLEGKTLPLSIREFLSCQWPDVLFDIAVSQGVGSGDWLSVMLLQEQLLQSVNPANNEAQQNELARMVPSLVKKLRDSLEQAGYSLAETSPFFAQLKNLHLANVQKKLEMNDFVPWQTLSLDAWMPIEVVMVSDADRNFYEQVRAVAG